MMRTVLAALVASIAVPSVAAAHFIWIEASCEKSQCESHIYFGEYGTAAPETRETRLMERQATKAWLVASEGSQKQLALKTGDDSFHGVFLDGDEATRSIRAIDDQAEVVDWRKYRIGLVRPIFYARTFFPKAEGESTGTSESFKPLQALDLIPTVLASEDGYSAGERIQFQVFYQGAPLSQRASIRIYAPNGWSFEGTLGSDGRVDFTPPWPGLYVAEAIVQDETPGEFKGKAYEAVRHRATLSLRVAE